MKEALFYFTVVDLLSYKLQDVIKLRNNRNLNIYKELSIDKSWDNIMLEQSHERTVKHS
jgi:hypothetical protein